MPPPPLPPARVFGTSVGRVCSEPFMRFILSAVFHAVAASLPRQSFHAAFSLPFFFFSCVLPSTLTRVFGTSVGCVSSKPLLGFAEVYIKYHGPSAIFHATLLSSALPFSSPSRVCCPKLARLFPEPLYAYLRNFCWDLQWFILSVVFHAVAVAPAFSPHAATSPVVFILLLMCFASRFATHTWYSIFKF